MSTDLLTVFSPGFPNTLRRVEAGVLSRAKAALPDDAWIDRAWSLAHILHLDADALAGFAAEDNAAYLARLGALRERAPVGAILDLAGGEAVVHATVGLPDGTVVTETWDGRDVDDTELTASLEAYFDRVAATLSELLATAEDPEQAG